MNGPDLVHPNGSRGTRGRVVIGGGVAAAGPATLEPYESCIARERAAWHLADAPADATVELRSRTEAPGARAEAAIARYRIGLPEREGVGER